MLWEFIIVYDRPTLSINYFGCSIPSRLGELVSTELLLLVDCICMSTGQEFSRFEFFWLLSDIKIGCVKDGATPMCSTRPLVTSC